MFYPNEEQDLYNQIDLSDSQFNQYVQKIEQGNIVDTTDPQFQSQNQLQPLIYSTLDLDYNIFLSEEELKFYKSLLVEKQSKIRQLKQKYTKKNSKALSLIEGLKRLQKKIKEISDGYKHLTDKHQQSLKNENSFRNKRLACQQRKTHLYKKLCELQSVHQNYMNDINSYEEYDEQFNYICQQNDRMEQEIERLQNRRKEVYEGGQSTNRKEQLKSNIKKLYERIKVAEKQEIEITQQYQTKRKRLRLLEKEQTNINSKNIQITALMNRIQKLKEECNDASYAKLELQNQYRGLLSQQSMLKKTIIGENHSNSSKKKQTSEKAKVVHNFKIIDTEGDEQLKFNSKKRSNSRHHNNSMQSQGQLDDLINRFERIKSKSKTNI